MPQWHPWEDWAAAQREEAESPTAAGFLWTSWARADTVEVSAPLRRPKPGQGAIQFADSDSLGMAKLAQALQQLRSGGVLRILHFGDSQIEGDRITGDLRDALQALYGGEGAGMQPLVPFVPMAAVAHTAEGSWTRMVSFGRANDKSPTNHVWPTGHFPSLRDQIHFGPRRQSALQSAQLRLSTGTTEPLLFPPTRTRQGAG